jgi:predicted RNA binding protein YcfA (HicA-like mRNA interferase family)
MPVKRRDLIRYPEENGFYLLREGGKHSIYANNPKDASHQAAPHHRPNNSKRALQTSRIESDILILRVLVLL